MTYESSLANVFRITLLTQICEQSNHLDWSKRQHSIREVTERQAVGQFLDCEILRKLDGDRFFKPCDYRIGCNRSIEHVAMPLVA